ncbi:MAG: rod shape-determining protein RodA [Ignavibacteriae bacterium]|nr:rod shape-determining protein RodA [Ignavibacteriota bacterium]
MASFVKEYIDYKTIPIALALAVFGLVSIYSATYDAQMSEVTYKQLIWAGVGTAVMCIVALTPLRMLQRLSYPAYFLSLLLLASVLLLGKTVSGSTSWFNFGTLRFQPSEFAKITTVLAIAMYLARNDVSLRKVKDLAVVGSMVIIPVVLILKQPDTGTAIIYFGMLFPVLYWGGATRFTLLAIVAPLVAAIAALFGTTPFLISVIVLGTLLYLTKEHRIVAAIVFSVTVLVGISVQSIYSGLKPYQQKRIDTFLDPAADPQGAGYNVLQSKVAIGSGGFFGKGYLHGTQTQLNFIPEQWTDFIFCVPGEEFGFFGSTIVLVLFMGLLLRGITIASSVKTPYGSLVALGVTAIFATHVFINIGMSLGLLPVIGVPLPFLSYGGSAMITNMAMVGLLANLHAHRKEY